ncbi:VCBS repeat-containing protein [Spirosoma sp. KUDC1026]|uniref:VCBS repeat-containing protein n=1 Tax=Spirosoma sp. KUDC1026 TaxID=2745947 RepID=UPI00159BD7FB|nr:VCBS repeat-containing protein [Spirosoma sp. KUDC1026]QKZ13424.1 VCBS repeat-containing protein [Spirosoma sp. KUDC1026]
MIKRVYGWLYVGMTSLAMACQSGETPLFNELTADQTGITFVNDVKQEGENNVLNYPYYFNGGGVAVGDLNNDGRPDIYFTGNKTPNRLYLNQGGLTFTDVTDKAGVAATDGWKTGVTLADVNQDGWLDIYVCRSAMGDSTLRRNLLFINNKDTLNGGPTFSERAAEYGIADASYSTQAAFFDYDHDGDPDLFVLNHSLPQYAGFSKLLGSYKQEKDNRFGSKLYRNDKGPDEKPHFTDVSTQSGLINNVLSFGLGIAVSDVNADGWPDLYVSNDFNEEDYLYLNTGQHGPGKPSFRNVAREATGHTSLFSMGSDVADINNDARPDILTLDMLPATNERIKLSSGDDNYDKYRMLLDAGFHPQTMRNMLQLNNGVTTSENGLAMPTFSEIGQLSGIANTDWSWSALLADYDGDGWKDLFVTNGYEKDYTNMEFLKFTVDERVKARETGQGASVDQILDRMPSIDVGGFLFRNNADLTFTDVTKDWGLTRAIKANGAAYADLDSDGDLDLIANAMNAPAVIYQNKAVEDRNATFLTINLQQNNPARQLTGTKVWVYAGGHAQYQEFSPVRGFQSCQYVPLTIGLNRQQKADSVRIVYPDGHTQLVRNVPASKVLAPRYEDATQVFTYPQPSAALFAETVVSGWRHTPIDTNDFKRQQLLPYQFSYSGPKLATGDVNKDGRNDLYVAGAKGQAGVLWLQQADGTLRQQSVSAFEQDRGSQDEAAAFFDADKDGDLDVYVVSGGYPFAQNDPLLQDRLYLGDGRGNFTKAVNALPKETVAGACVTPFDVDHDGDLDLFVGARFVPGNYPTVARSSVLLNDGHGHFTDATPICLGNAEKLGLVCDARAADINRDGWPDLVLAGEWMPMTVLINQKGKLTDQSVQWFPANTEGWWNCLAVADFDKDGDMDVVAGNYGLNTQWKASTRTPVTLTYSDFDNDGNIDPFLAYYVGNKSYPYASRDEALSQVAMLKGRFPDYTQYANATLTDLFKPEELKRASQNTANWMATTYWENQNGRFVAHRLPVQAQFAPIFAIEPFDYDHDGDLDLVMGGNLTHTRVRIGQSDASYLPVFENTNHQFQFVANAGGRTNVRGIARLSDNELVVGSNDAPLLLLTQPKTAGRPLNL